MIELARERAPEAEFRVGSLYDAEIPPCGAVTAVGEVLNYLFDEEGGGLLPLFRRVYEALVPGGVFVFDAWSRAGAAGHDGEGFSVGEDWAVLSEREEDASGERWSAGSSASGRLGNTTGGPTRYTACGCTTRGASRRARTRASRSRR